MLWSLLLLVPLVVFAGRWPALRTAIADRRVLAMLATSAALVAANWLVYIWSVLNHHVLATSLGYFLNPLVNVALGTLFLKERLTKGQGAAVALAAIAVAILALGAAEGLWISLALAASFGLYGLVRKLAPVEAIEGLAIETGLLALPSLCFVIWSVTGGVLVFGSDLRITVLLVLSGAITATPLLLFAAAARRLRYSTLGLLQYLAPTLQFVLAITVFNEPLRPVQFACFGLIWAACLVYAWSSLAEHRRAAIAPPE